MNRRWHGLNLLAAVLVALAQSAPATAGRNDPVAGKLVTFLARSSGMVTTESVTFPVPDGPPVIATKLVGDGPSAPLGHFTVTAQVVIDVPAGATTGRWTLTVDSGDKLFVSFVAYTAKETELLGLPNLQSGGFFTIEGGTGRFQGATGSYTQLITFASDPAKGPTAYTDILAGRISP